MRFSIFSFFSSLEPAWDTDQWVKIFRIWLSFRWVIEIFLNLCAASYCAKSVSQQYVTALIQSSRSMILRGVTQGPRKSTAISFSFAQAFKGRVSKK